MTPLFKIPVTGGVLVGFGKKDSAGHAVEDHIDFILNELKANNGIVPFRSQVGLILITPEGTIDIFCTTSPKSPKSKLRSGGLIAVSELVLNHI